ncbi:MAG: DUF1127 domain-containing protein [Paracoccaceae bacterium]|nr:DUF1127 domain-containing protein [Paracoccaceae bacterium]
MSAIDARPHRGYRNPALPLAGWVAAFGDWRRTRAAEAELARLPDHVLDDIGLIRSDISRAVRQGRR